MSTVAFALIMTIVAVDYTTPPPRFVNVHTVRQFYQSESRCYAELTRLMTDMPPGMSWGGQRPHPNTGEMSVCERVKAPK
jgi:hypothetical protein